MKSSTLLLLSILTSGAKQDRVRLEVLLAARGERHEYVFSPGGRLVQTSRDTGGD